MKRINAYHFAADQHEDYRQDVEGRDEIYAWMRPDEKAIAWAVKHGDYRTSVHHIHGRGKRREYHWYCNLVCATNALHAYGHDVDPPVLEICSLRAKLQRELERLAQQKPLPVDPRYRHWHPKVMAENIGYDSLHGRVLMLISKKGVRGSIFEQYAHEMLDYLHKGIAPPSDAN